MRMDPTQGQRFQGLARPFHFLLGKHQMPEKPPKMNSRLQDTKTKLFSPGEQDLHRQLIEQFYKNSIDRYGVDSEQSRIFAQQLSAYSGAGE